MADGYWADKLGKIDEEYQNLVTYKPDKSLYDRWAALPTIKPSGRVVPAGIVDTTTPPIVSRAIGRGTPSITSGMVPSDQVPVSADNSPQVATTTGPWSTFLNKNRSNSASSANSILPTMADADINTPDRRMPSDMYPGVIPATKSIFEGINRDDTAARESAVQGAAGQGHIFNNEDVAALYGGDVKSKLTDEENIANIRQAGEETARGIAMRDAADIITRAFNQPTKANLMAAKFAQDTLKDMGIADVEYKKLLSSKGVNDAQIAHWNAQSNLLKRQQSILPESYQEAEKSALEKIKAGHPPVEKTSLEESYLMALSKADMPEQQQTIHDTFAAIVKGREKLKGGTSKSVMTFDDYRKLAIANGISDENRIKEGYKQDYGG